MLVGCVGRYVSTGDVTNAKTLRHFGLGLDFYTHFTSPIRRYADVVVRRHCHWCPWLPCRPLPLPPIVCGSCGDTRTHGVVCGVVSLCGRSQVHRCLPAALARRTASWLSSQLVCTT